MPPGIRREAGDGYDIYVKDDGVDYWRIVKACIDENIDQNELIRNWPARPDFTVKRDGVELVLHPLTYKNPKRMVFRLDAGGRRFILKRARMGAAGFKHLLPGVMGLSYYTRIMRLVNRAVRACADITQDYFLVAEKRISAFRQEVWLLLDYVEGEELNQQSLERYRAELVRTMDEMFRHDLTMDDLALWNFLVCGDGRVRAIDISCRPFTRLQTVKMAMKMNERHGLCFPIRGVVNNLLRLALAGRYQVKKALGGKNDF